MEDRNDAESILNDIHRVYTVEEAPSIDTELHLSESRDIIEVPRSNPATYTNHQLPTTSAQPAQQPMWAMQPPQPYVPRTSSNSEEEIPVNIGRAKIRSPNGGSTHFNVFLNQTPQQQPPPPQQQHHTPQQNYGGWQQPQIYNTPTPSMPQMYVQTGQPMYATPPPPMGPGYNCYNPYGMGGPQQPTVVYMNQQPQQPTKVSTPPPKKVEEEEEPKSDPNPPPPPPPPPVTPPPPPKPTTDEMTPICIASIIIACLAFIMGILCLVKTDEAYHAYITYEENGNGNESSVLFESWQMCRNIALGAGASCVSIYSLAFLLVFWSGMQHKMRRKVVSGCCMTFVLIGAWILFAFSFVVDVVVLVLAFDVDNVVYPEIVWAAFIGHSVAWLGMLVNSEIARRWIADS